MTNKYLTWISKQATVNQDNHPIASVTGGILGGVGGFKLGQRVGGMVHRAVGGGAPGLIGAVATNAAVTIAGAKTLSRASANLAAKIQGKKKD